MDPQGKPAEAPPPAPVWKRVFGGKRTELPENVKNRCALFGFMMSTQMRTMTLMPHEPRWLPTG